MTAITVKGAFAAGGSTASTAPLLVLLPSIGTRATTVWGGVIERLVSDPVGSGLRILTIDLPGHGWSPATRDEVSIGELADAVLSVVDEAGADAFHVAGVSLGGAVALELAATAPERVSSLVMLCSGARIGTRESWGARATGVRASGTASLVTGSAGRWFAPDFLVQDGGGVGARALAELLDVDDESYARCAEALGRWDRTSSAPAVRQRALLVSGRFDGVTTPESMQALAESLPDARHQVIEGASHLAPLERPTGVAELLLGHLVTGVDASRLGIRAAGSTVRRAVLGDAHVDRATAAIVPATADFQDFITRYAWGEVWSRPGLTRRERSMITLASLVTGGHHDELLMHLRAAFRNGVTETEVREVLQHTALYAGLPAANSAFALLRTVLAEAAEPAEWPETSETQHTRADPDLAGDSRG